MILDDQTEVTAFLSTPATHGGTDPVEVLDTHISRVFLAGDRACKLKRAVLLPYADFSTPAIRLAACQKEYALNAPTAPAIYRGFRSITRAADGGLVFDGAGPLVDAVVDMARFDQNLLLDRVAEAGNLTEGHIAALARSIEALHANAPVIGQIGGAANMAAVLDINRAGFATSTVFQPDKVAALDEALRRNLGHHAGWLDRRARAGRVRRCHGDLHLRNICLFEGAPQIFDCLDFNDALATVDVLYDLAFLLMDLWHRDLRPLANLLANRYFDETETDDGWGLLPFFMAVRAEVRAHVTATAAESAGTQRDALADLAREYFDLAWSFLRAEGGQVVAVGGLSGSGKTTIAERIAPCIGLPPGARVIESDRTRKQMFGVAPEEHLPQEAYAPKVSDEVYHRVSARARQVAASGGAVVVGAVFDQPGLRADLVTAMKTLSFTPLWLDVGAGRLHERLAARKASASDATLDILDLQLSHFEGGVEWRPVDGNGTLDETVAAILCILRGAA
ncbi:hypothetical protein RGUI_3595 [Rhodovulum sp. P5]|uniref:bifunctional aminoglycoside phosphotransferase/ATP-binding protein n=1 Tax=Rhodovulum sp. P5 TaxID=1564506 RepID=UPI0009C346BE|nr:AAA family ATPase [Rhodovulum sp. P5]ARE41736.1 hypothetical protein RGUI_3595 [Rhodovulum sp. P5]